MDEESQVRGCYNITFICTNQEAVQTMYTDAMAATWTQQTNKQPASAEILGEKGRCTSSFNTLDNWGHKTPTQSKRKGRQEKKRLKGHGPEHTQYTRLH